MGLLRNKIIFAGAMLVSLPVLCDSAFAAKAIDLSKQKVSLFTRALTTAYDMQETKRSVDLNNTLHVRMQQYYQGYEVLGADAILHVKQAGKTARLLSQELASSNDKNSSMNGIVYQDLAVDLNNAPKFVFADEQAQKALQQSIENYQQKIGAKPVINEKQTKLVVFVDASGKAHWAYLTKFYAKPATYGAMPSIPVNVVDAVTFKVYEQWDNIQTINPNLVDGGGFGGNIKTGKLSYDGGENNFASFKVTRFGTSTTCLMRNSNVVVINAKGYENSLITYPCRSTSSSHNGVYWSDSLESANDGFSPPNDAMFGGQVIKSMYRTWYKMDPLVDKNGKPMILTMAVHDPIGDNAYWDGMKMSFGDGRYMFYPLTSLGVAAHEVSHGFTEQHSKLKYRYQSGGMNEAFSDMAAQAAEIFAYGKNSWQIGPEIFKQENKALRYMDVPSKDGRSIDSAKDYSSSMDVHHTSGVFNRMFYLIATAKGWDVKKAFDVMVLANTNYWTAESTFQQGACGVMQAAYDLKHDLKSVSKAITKVGLDPKACLIKM